VKKRRSSFVQIPVGTITQTPVYRIKVFAGP